jgi:glycine betaine/choline ABC-type transport system substrate-binding protein
MKKIKLLIVFPIILGVLCGCSQKESDIVVGTKDFTEQYVLGNILVLLIEAHTNLTVAYKNDLASDVIFAGVRTGVIDLYVEYTGTAYGSYLRLSETLNAEEVYETSVRELYEKHNLRMLDLLGFNNTFSLAVRTDIATEHTLRTISDLARISPDLTFGGSSEFLSRYDGLPNLKKHYGMSFAEEIIMDGITRYNAIANDEVQVIVAFSTDGTLLNFNIVVLEDDLGFFPPYHGAIIIRDETTESHPELLNVLQLLAGELTDEVMRALNYRVDVLGELPRTVAEEFLKENNFFR